MLIEEENCTTEKGVSMSKSDSFHRGSEWKKIRKAYLDTVPEPYICAICGKEGLAGLDCQVDHINPGHQGDGEYEWDNSHDNFQILCASCNGRKRDKVVKPKQVRIPWRSDKW